MIWSFAGIETEDNDMVRLRFFNGRIATAFSACLLFSACVSHVQDADTMEVWDFLGCNRVECHTEEAQILSRNENVQLKDGGSMRYA